ncbi:synaptonemal complex central element protein 2 isoform X1 [Catharus ustulatus]|uniref:synaptonemal complex central element protein 2 isoform X1 n=1 Tax=Catharus ustulatus TaxID=91951 RepID=UPI00140E60B5|nr:synaptonemal complex central element protein 2 isoform X1 [Catharus ustulatus]
MRSMPLTGGPCPCMTHGEGPSWDGGCIPRTEGPEFRPRPRAEPALGHRSSLYFASLGATIDGLQQQARDICNRVTESRQEDQTVLNSFRESLLLKVLKLAEQLEERLFRSYDSYNKLIEERLQELSEVLERVEGVQAELRCICCTIEAAYQDLCLQPEP